MFLCARRATEMQRENQLSVTRTLIGKEKETVVEIRGKKRENVYI